MRKEVSAGKERGKFVDPLTIASQSRDDFNVSVTPAAEPESRRIRNQY